MQHLSDSLCRGAGEKAGFNDDDGWTDGNCTLIQTTEARGHWVPSSYPLMDPGAPQAIPLHTEGDTAVGLNTGRPDGAHRVENHSVSVHPGKRGRECGPVLILFRQIALYAAQARICLCLDFCAHTVMPTLHFPLAIGQPCGTSDMMRSNLPHLSTGHAHFQGLPWGSGYLSWWHCWCISPICHLTPFP